MSKKLSEALGDKPVIKLPRQSSIDKSEMAELQINGISSNPFRPNSMKRDKSSSQSQMYSGRFGVPSSLLSGEKASEMDFKIEEQILLVPVRHNSVPKKSSDSLVSRNSNQL
jgi:hypothetical protein